MFSLPVKDINLDLLGIYSKELASNINQSGFTPNHILFVERAGLLIGSQIADYFDCSISGIATKRTGGATKSRLKVFLRYLPRFITHFLRRMEINSSIHEVKSERKIVTDYPLPGKDRKILLVDDAIDTGYSIQAVIEFLLAEGFKRDLIKVAVITTTAKNAKYKADFSLFDEVICAFPWSYDSREYDKAWLLYNAKRKLICKEI